MTLPNQLTVLRIVLTPLALYFLLKQGNTARYLATGVFIIASLTDWYDGHFARKFGYVSKWGKFLDPFADKFLISTMLFGFVILKYIKFGWVIVIVLRDVFITALRGYMIAYGKPMSASLIAKWKTFCQVFLVYILLLYMNIEVLFGIDPGTKSETYLSTLKVFIDNYLIFIGVFTVATGLHYLIQHRRPLRELFLRFYKLVMPS